MDLDAARDLGYAEISSRQLDVTVAIVDLPEALDGLVEYYRRISGEHPDWADYRAAMERDQRVLRKPRITRAGPDRHG
jgi:hypothetical protein